MSKGAQRFTKRDLTDRQMKSLLYMYRNQYGMQEIQERFNLDITTIIKLLKEHDVHIRKRVDKRK